MAFIILAGMLAAATAILTSSLWMKKRPLDIPSLEGKHVFITGASSGIGLAIAKQALVEGAFVTLTARNELKINKAVEELVTELQCNTDRIRAAVADVGDSGAIAEAVKAAFAWRPIDVLVCNAGLTRAGYTEELPVHVLDEQVRTNLLGVVYTVHAALPLMKRRNTQDKSAIVIVSSAAGMFLLYGSAVYTATKHALKGFAACLRLELLPHNINVNLICPGFVHTNLIDNVDKEGEFDGILQKFNLYDKSKFQTPERIAKCTLRAIKTGEFLVITTKVFFPLVAASRGIYASSSFTETLKEAFWLPLIRVVTFKVSRDLEQEILKHHQQKKLRN